MSGDLTALLATAAVLAGLWIFWAYRDRIRHRLWTGWVWLQEPAEQRAWDRSARDAARAEAVADDVADRRREREIAELYAMCPDIMRVVELPNQTRRPRKDQP